MAAEVIAGAWVAEEVVSTTVQAGVGAYMVAKPTMPLKATFKQIATSHDDDTRLSLVRSGHTVTCINGKAYIFGGETASDKLAGNEIHAILIDPTEKPEPDYSVLPAIPDVEGGVLPPARTNHAACKLNTCVAIFGGVDHSGTLVDSDPIIWLYETTKQNWEPLKAESASIAPVQRSKASLFAYEKFLILYGGIDANGQELKDVWHFHSTAKKWTPLPSAPVSSSNATLCEGVLYIISAEDQMSGDVHFLNTKDPKTASWSSTTFPSSPMAPGPRPRTGAGLLPITTGYGRNYLLYFFGERHPSHLPTADETDPTQWSDLWTFQIESAQAELKATTSLAEALKPARIKDAIREKLGYDSGSHRWGEVEVLPPEELGERAGKVHPGPRAFVGCDVVGDGGRVVVWGGVNARGEREGDGWVISFT